MSSLISVVIAAYNIENYIDKCIQSVIDQTYTDLEILVVNDGSKDSTLERARQYERDDKRVIVLDKKNGGLSDARNYGIEHSSGDYLIFIDGDDYISPHMIEKLYKALCDNDADLSICNIQNVDENGNLLESSDEKYFEERTCSKDEMLDIIATPPNWFYVVAWNKLYKKSIFNNLRFAKGKIHEDEFLIHRALNECKRIQIIPDRLYFYVQRQYSITHDEYKVSHLDVVEAFLDRAEFYFDNQSYDNAIKTMKRVRTYYLDGYIALMNNKTPEKGERLKNLHKKYQEIYRKNRIGISKNTALLWLFDKSLIISVYSSGNYRNTRRVK